MHMLWALAFVPKADVLTSLSELGRECLAELRGVYYEFKKFFITGKPAMGVAQPYGPSIKYHCGTNTKQLLTNRIIPTTCQKAGPVASNLLLVNTIRIFTQRSEKHSNSDVDF